MAGDRQDWDAQPSVDPGNWDHILANLGGAAAGWPGDLEALLRSIIGSGIGGTMMGTEPNRDASLVDPQPNLPTTQELIEAMGQEEDLLLQMFAPDLAGPLDELMAAISPLLAAIGKTDWFHGTGKVFDRFKGPTYLTESPHYASYYASGEATGSPLSYRPGRDDALQEISVEERKALEESIAQRGEELQFTDEETEFWYDFQKRDSEARGLRSLFQEGDDIPPKVQEKLDAVEADRPRYEALQEKHNQQLELGYEYRGLPSSDAPNVRPVVPDVQNIKYLDSENAIYTLGEDPDAIRKLQEQGYDAAAWTPGDKSEFGEMGDYQYGSELLVFDPRDVRGKYEKWDMDPEAVARRAEKQGYDIEGYHGSTHNIERFDGSTANPGNDWGAATYQSTSPEDVKQNYAGVGPDLQGRIGMSAESLQDNIEMGDVDVTEYGYTMEQFEADPEGVAGEIIRKELVGEAPEGVTYGLRTRSEDYARIGGPDETVFREKGPTLEQRFEAENPKDSFDSEDDYWDAYYEYESENVWNSELNERIYEALDDALLTTDLSADDRAEHINRIMSDGGIFDMAQTDGEVPASLLEDMIREQLAGEVLIDGATDEPLYPGSIAARTFEAMGYKGVIDHRVNQKFGTQRQFGGSMPGVDEDTIHIITFPGHENTLRLKHAEYDPEKIEVNDPLALNQLTAALAGRVA